MYCFVSGKAKTLPCSVSKVSREQGGKCTPLSASCHVRAWPLSRVECDHDPKSIAPLCSVGFVLFYISSCPCAASKRETETKQNKNSTIKVLPYHMSSKVEKWMSKILDLSQAITQFLKMGIRTQQRFILNIHSHTTVYLFILCTNSFNKWCFSLFSNLIYNDVLRSRLTDRGRANDDCVRNFGYLIHGRVEYAYVCVHPNRSHGCPSSLHIQEINSKKSFWKRCFLCHKIEFMNTPTLHLPTVVQNFGFCEDIFRRDKIFLAFFRCFSCLTSFFENQRTIAAQRNANFCSQKHTPKYWNNYTSSIPARRQWRM